MYKAKNFSTSIILVVITLLMNASCVSARIKYEADLKTEENNYKHIIYYQSIGTGEHSAGCLSSYLLLGGWCWAYLNTPNQFQRDLVSYNASQVIYSKFGASTEISNVIFETSGRDNFEPPKQKFASIKKPKSFTLFKTPKDDPDQELPLGQLITGITLTTFAGLLLAPSAGLVAVLAVPFSFSGITLIASSFMESSYK